MLCDVACDYLTVRLIDTREVTHYDNATATAIAPLFLHSKNSDGHLALQKLLNRSWPQK